jgi:hypothetical protein
MKKTLLFCAIALIVATGSAQDKCSQLFSDGKRMHDNATDVKTYEAARKIFKEGLDAGCDKAEFQYWYNICQTKIDYFTATLEYTPKNLEFESSGGKKNITVNTSYKDWDIKAPHPSLNDWLTGNKENQTTLTITCKENRSLKSRNTTVTLNAGNKTAKIDITQQGKKYLLPEVLKLLQSNLQSNTTITSKSNMKYKGEKSASGQRAGLGGQLDTDGNLFFGNFANGEPVNGIYLDGDVKIANTRVTNKFQVGNFADFQLNGEAKCYDEDGVLSYQGVFYNDAPKGASYWTDNRYPSLRFEIIEEKDGFYIGETKEGQREGKGIFISKAGDLWYGDWQRGKKSNGIEIKMDGTIK